MLLLFLIYTFVFLKKCMMLTLLFAEEYQITSGFSATT